MREKVRVFLSSGANRRSLMSAGAYIAGAYTGFAVPGGVEAIHEALQYAVSLNPFADPVAQVTALFEGAQYQAASALHSVGEWFQSAGVEVAQRLRDEIDRARAFIGPALDQARTFFVETWRPLSESAGALRDQIRNAVPDRETVITWSKEVGQAAYDLAKSAAEAYGVYEVAKKVYGRLFSRAKADLAERAEPAPGETDAVTARTQNLNVNTAIGGGPVADAALRSCEIRFRGSVDPTAGLSALSPDRIIWVSDKLSRRVSDDLNDLIADADQGRRRVSIPRAVARRLEDPVDPVADLSHRARFPTINWDESALSADRLGRLRSGLTGTGDPGRPEGALGLKLTLSKDGTLRAERQRPAAPPPDLMM